MSKPKPKPPQPPKGTVMRSRGPQMDRKSCVDCGFEGCDTCGEWKKVPPGIHCTMCNGAGWYWMSQDCHMCDDGIQRKRKLRGEAEPASP